MSDYSPLLITARLASPLAGDAPRLDGLVEYAMSLFHPKAIPGYKITRASEPPEMGLIPISMARESIGGWPVARCSDPILDLPDAETVEHIGKKIGIEHAELLRPDARLVVSTTNSWTKSYRIPLRIRACSRVRWFAFGNRVGLKRSLRHITSIGKKVSVGYGRVAEWTLDRVDEDYSWFAPAPAGPVLMATLPHGPWLPGGLIGAKRDFRSCVPPYWHPARYTEAVVPC
jgi:hypothetical protein